MHRNALSALPVLLMAVGCSDTETSGVTGTRGIAQPARQAATPSRFDRHPKRFSPSFRPSGVPDDYVLTRNGFMAPSCVFSVDSDETVDHDGTIRGPDGTVRDVMPPCPYPRFRRDGQVVAQEEGTPHAPQPHAYDGWIVFYGYSGSIAADTTLSTDWVVPLSPTVTTTQDVAFFNDIETEGSETDILQPVLDYNSDRWTIESEHCCIAGNDSYNSPPTTLSVGDAIHGTVQGSNCKSNGSCSTWVVTTVDVTKNVTATLTVTNAAGTPVMVHPAVLETYSITDCNMLPASGRITFANNSLTDANGNPQSVKYTLGTDYPSSYPKCGFSGSASGNDYTLVFNSSAGGLTGSGGVSSTGGRGGNTGAGGGTGGAGGTSGGGSTGSGGTQSPDGAAGTNGGGATGLGGSRTRDGAAGTSADAASDAAGASGGDVKGSGGVAATGGAGATGSGGVTGAGGGRASGGSTGVGSGGATGAGGAATDPSTGAGGGGSTGAGGIAPAGGSTGPGGGGSSTAGSSASSGGATGSNSGTASGTGGTAGDSGAVTRTDGGAAAAKAAGGCGCRIPGERGRARGFVGQASILWVGGLIWLSHRRRRHSCRRTIRRLPARQS